MESLEEYSILCLGDQSCGKEEVIKYLIGNKILDLINSNFGFRMCNEKSLPIIKLYDFDISIDKETEDLEEYFKKLHKLAKDLYFGVNCIMVFFPLTQIRANPSYIFQVNHFLGRDCSFNGNLISILTQSKNLNENIRSERVNKYLSQLSSLLSKNLICMGDENIILFDEDFKVKLNLFLKNSKPYKVKLFTDFQNIIFSEKYPIEFVLKIASKNEEFKCFIDNIITKEDLIKLNNKSRSHISKENRFKKKWIFFLMILSILGLIYYSEINLRKLWGKIVSFINSLLK